jgi:hypothetical protein
MPDRVAVLRAEQTRPGSRHAGGPRSSRPQPTGSQTSSASWATPTPRRSR